MHSLIPKIYGRILSFHDWIVRSSYIKHFVNYLDERSCLSLSFWILRLYGLRSVIMEEGFWAE